MPKYARDKDPYPIRRTPLTIGMARMASAPRQRSPCKAAPVPKTFAAVGVGVANPLVPTAPRNLGRACMARRRVLRILVTRNRVMERGDHAAH